MSSVLKAIAGVSLVALAVTGCQVSSDSDITGSGTFSLDVTDAPVDEATAVNVVFEGVDIQAASGTRIEITYDTPRSINLLDLQGGDTKPLLEGETLAAGEYEWIRLRVDADRGTSTSTIEFENKSPESLFIPSGSSSGLKLVRGFTVPVNGSVSFTIDFDLRKSVVEAGGQYILKPTLRLVDNSEVGSISGTVNGTIIDDFNTATAGACDDGKAVYVYEGSDITPTEVGGGSNDPISSAMVELLETGEYGYKAAFLTEGEYTVAFTCDADLDEPENTSDNPDSLTFTAAKNVTVTADATVTINF